MRQSNPCFDSATRHAAAKASLFQLPDDASCDYGSFRHCPCADSKLNIETRRAAATALLTGGFACTCLRRQYLQTIVPTLGANAPGICEPAPSKRSITALKRISCNRSSGLAHAMQRASIDGNGAHQPSRAAPRRRPAAPCARRSPNGAAAYVHGNSCAALCAPCRNRSRSAWRTSTSSAPRILLSSASGSRRAPPVSHRQMHARSASA